MPIFSSRYLPRGWNLRISSVGASSGMAETLSTWVCAGAAVGRARKEKERNAAFSSRRGGPALKRIYTANAIMAPPVNETSATRRFPRLRTSTSGPCGFIQKRRISYHSGRNEAPARRGADRRRSDRAPAPPHDQRFQLLDRALHPLEVGIDRERAAEILQRLLRLVEPQVDLAVARERTEVLRVAPDDFVAVLERAPVFAGEVVRRRALVPAFSEVGFQLDDAGEGRDRFGEPLSAHLRDSPPEHIVDPLVSGAAP